MYVSAANVDPNTSAHRTSTASTRGAMAYLAWSPAPPPVLGTNGTIATVAMSVIAMSATIAP
jgi:hypothetical protein